MSLAQYSNNPGGFGLTALSNARAAGLTDAQIRKQLSSSGLTIGGGAAGQLGADTDLYQYRGSGGQFGLDSYNNARAAGLNNGQIRSSLAMSGLQIGDKAGEQLNVDGGYTYMGYAPGVRNQTSYAGNSGKMYDLRPLLAPRGAVTDGSQSQRLGYSPTVYAAGGTDDNSLLNTIFQTNQNAQQIGGGYSDPDFHRVNAGAPKGMENYMAPGQSGQGSVNAGAGKNVNVKTGNLTVGDRTSNSTMKIGDKKKDTTASGSSAFKRTNTSLSV